MSTPRNLPNSLNLKHPFRCIIIGQSYKEKLSILFNNIVFCSQFDKTYIYSRNLANPIFRHYNHIGRKNNLELITNDINNCISIDEVDKNIQNLFIFDDTDRISSDFFMKSNNISTVFISPSYFNVPRTIQLNSDYYLLTEGSNECELAEISKDHTIPDLVRRYNMWFGFPNHFFFINLKNKYPISMWKRNCTV